MASTILPPNTVPYSQVFGEPHLHLDGDLVALTFSPDGGLWTVEEPGVLRHWDPASGRQIEWQSLSDLETLWCFSRDARVLASGSSDLTFWDASSGQVLTALPQPSWVTAMAFHPDAAFLATGHDDGVVRLWDAAGHSLVREFRLHTRSVSALAFTADGSRLATAGEDKAIGVWNVDDGRRLATLSGHTDRIPALAWHPGGNFLISAGWDSTARIWDMHKQEPVILLNTHDAQVTALAVSHDGSLVATADAGLHVRVWDFNKRIELHVLKGPRAEIRCLGFSQDDRRLAGNGDHMIHIWDPRTGQLLAGSGPRSLALNSLALSPDGTRLATNGGGSAGKVWNTVSRQVVAELKGESVIHAVAFSSDGKWLAGACEQHLRLWDAATGQELPPLEGSAEPFTSVAFSPDGKLLASASSSGLGVWIWRTADGEPVLLIPDALDGCTVEAIAFHPDGRLLAVGGIDWLATGGSDGAICVWDVEDRCEVATFLGGVTCLAYHPSGSRIACGSLQPTVCIWDASSQEIVDELTGPENTINCLAYNHDGTLLAAGGEDRMLRLWNENGEELAVLELDSQVTGLVFSSDGKFLYAANGNTTCSQFTVKQLLKS
jgi:WD40 repeat protein